MQRIPRMIGDMLENNPMLLAGIGAIVLLVALGVVIARITKPKRMQRHAKIRRPRD